MGEELVQGKVHTQRDRSNVVFSEPEDPNQSQDA